MRLNKESKFWLQTVKYVYDCVLALGMYVGFGGDGPPGRWTLSHM